MRYIVYWKFSPSFRRRLMRKHPGFDPNNIRRGSIVMAHGVNEAELKWKSKAPPHRVFVSTAEDHGQEPTKQQMKAIKNHIKNLK